MRRANINGMRRSRDIVWLLLLGLSLAAATPGRAKPAGPPTTGTTTRPRPQPLPPDRSTALPPRRPDAARLRQLAAQREFRYVEPNASTDAWDAFWARLGHWLDELMSTRAGHFTWKYGIYAAVLAALVFAVLKLLQVDITGAFGRSARRGQLAYGLEAENIHEVDFAAHIAAAEAAGNLRLATRLGYLEVLKHLTDHGLIHWQPDKTNHTYLAELAAGPLRNDFWAATRQFEYVWYGELRLNAALYQQARAGQRAVTSQLAGRRVATPAPVSSPNKLTV